MKPSEFIEKYMMGKCFYHFTDTRNVPSIKSHGLMSLHLLRERGIAPPAAGGNDWSHEADERLGLHSYVHLCFLDQHPMEWTIRQDGRIKDTVFIKVDKSVLTRPGILLSNDVSNKAGVETFDFTRALDLMDFPVIYERTDWKDAAVQERRNVAKKYELLVPDHISADLLSGY